jgi:hypothetical protein
MWWCTWKWQIIFNVPTFIDWRRLQLQIYLWVYGVGSFTSWVQPQGEFWPLLLNLAFGEELTPGGEHSPLRSPLGVNTLYSLEKWRGKKDFHTKGPTLSLYINVSRSLSSVQLPRADRPCLLDTTTGHNLFRALQAARLGVVTSPTTRYAQWNVFYNIKKFKFFSLQGT